MVINIVTGIQIFYAKHAQIYIFIAAKGLILFLWLEWWIVSNAIMAMSGPWTTHLDIFIWYFSQKFSLLRNVGYTSKQNSNDDN